MPPIFPGIGYTCFGVDRIRPGIRSGYRDAGSFALDDVLLAVPVEHDDVALLDESEPHRLGGLLKRRVKRNGVEAVRLPVRTALLQNMYTEHWILPDSAITSQNGTAPKPPSSSGGSKSSAITSQNGTAPKLLHRLTRPGGGAITSQNGTAPKLMMISMRHG